MSSNNQLIICKIRKEYCVFENPCVDNEFPNPKISRHALFKSKQLPQLIRWANDYCHAELVEYGIDMRI